MRKLREAAKLRSDLVALSTLYEAARDLFDERNGFVHGIIVNTARPAPEPLSFYLALQRPSDGTSRPLPSPAELADLTVGLDALASRVFDVWSHLLEEKKDAAADSPRTVEG